MVRKELGEMILIFITKDMDNTYNQLECSKNIEMHEYPIKIWIVLARKRPFFNNSQSMNKYMNDKECSTSTHFLNTILQDKY